MKWVATPRQNVFLHAKEDEVLYGGAAGGGKTDSLLALAAMRCSEVAGAHVLFLRKAYPDLEMSAIRRSQELFYGQGPKYNGGKYRWIWPNKATLQFGYIEKDSDVYRYQSAEFDLIIFDELTQFTEFQFQYMMSRLRTTKPGLKAMMRAASNPQGVGLAWVKKRFINPAPPGAVYHTPQGLKRRFIPAKVYDNPHLVERDPLYIKRLEQLPEVQRRQLLDGDWDVADGAAFPEWSRSIHVVKSFMPPPHWRRWRGNDPGYTDPFAWYWFAVDEDGVVYVYREFTREPGSERLTYSEQAREVMARSFMRNEQGQDVPETPMFTVVGRDAFNAHPETGKAITDYYREGGVVTCIQPPRAKQTDRILRKAVLHEYLLPYHDGNLDKKVAKLRVMDCCTKLIETLPDLVVDEKDAEKVAECSADHWFDALGYGLIAWHARATDALMDDKPLGLPHPLRDEDNTGERMETGRDYLSF